jgi:hypothetical protein
MFPFFDIDAHFVLKECGTLRKYAALRLCAESIAFMIICKFDDFVCFVLF